MLAPATGRFDNHSMVCQNRPAWWAKKDTIQGDPRQWPEKEFDKEMTPSYSGNHSKKRELRWAGMAWHGCNAHAKEIKE
jgi:hypothetical protein